MIFARATCHISWETAFRGPSFASFLPPATQGKQVPLVSPYASGPAGVRGAAVLRRAGRQRERGRRGAECGPGAGRGGAAAQHLRGSAPSLRVSVRRRGALNRGPPARRGGEPASAPHAFSVRKDSTRARPRAPRWSLERLRRARNVSRRALGRRGEASATVAPPPWRVPDVLVHYVLVHYLGGKASSRGAAHVTNNCRAISGLPAFPAMAAQIRALSPGLARSPRYPETEQGLRSQG